MAGARAQASIFIGCTIARFPPAAFHLIWESVTPQSTQTEPSTGHLSARLSAVLVLLGLSVFINYVDRGNLSIAAPMLKDELGISPSQLGILLSAFFWTYACLQPVTGWLVDRIDVKWVLAGGFLLWSAATAATGLLHTFAALFAVRLLIGVGESVAYPSYSKIIALHFPERRRGLANSVITAGLALGPGCGIVAGGILMARFGWRPFFVVLGVASLLWLVPWALLMPGANTAHDQSCADAPSLFEFVKMRSAWGTCGGLFASNYINYFLITWLPYYLVRERHFSMNSMAKIGGAAYLLAATAATTAGWLSDHWIAKGSTPTRVRKPICATGVATGGILLALSSIANPEICVILVILAVMFFGIGGCNIWAITQTLAGPQAAGRWTGFQNFVGNLAGVIAPAVTGFAVNATGHFYWALIIVAAVGVLGAASWLFVVGRVEQVSWRRELRAQSAAI